ncbi:MAG: hypothetical protein K9H25_04935 [Rhodospirillum sp.]|nr:hypothetical protein [Rhodospirillum sp.]MCF8490481.1 hypothetical protein [Rhodospirillum sp.]MCF8500087.1 hypothetical protein [Rhodospirillum sp.]
MARSEKQQGCRNGPSGRGLSWGTALLVLPVVAAFALLLLSLFLPLGVPDGPHGELSLDGHVALRLTILIGAGVTVVLMRLMFLSHESGLDRDVDEGLSAKDGRPIRPWDDGDR